MPSGLPEWPKCQEKNERSEVNSGTFYFRVAEASDWTAPGNSSLWQDAVKTLFDPCPVGWQVPRSGTGDLNPWQALTKDNSLWNNGSEAPAAGYHWPTAAAGVNTWYPQPGWRTGRSAAGMSGIGSEGSTHSSTAVPDSYAYRFCYTQLNITNLNYGAPRTQAISVRCIRE